MVRAGRTPAPGAGGDSVASRTAAAESRKVLVRLRGGERRCEIRARRLGACVAKLVDPATTRRMTA